jgi:protein-tyrosine phosphatase
VVQVAAEESPIQAPRDFLYFRIPILDGAVDQRDELALAIRALADLLSRRIPTLVCCGAGISRAPCLATAALAVAFRTPLDESLNQVMAHGPCDISPGLWHEVSHLLASWPSAPETTCGEESS